MDDSKIIDLFWQRSENAIQETDVKYGKLCMHLARNILSNNEDVEECVNDTYLGAWNAIPPAKPNALCAFIAKITRNLALKKFEFNTAQKRNPEVMISLTELEDCLSGSENAEDLYDAKALASHISTFLRKQDQLSRKVFIRRYWFYDSICEIATQLSMSESKVKTMLFRTRSKLKNYLVEEGYNL